MVKYLVLALIMVDVARKVTGQLSQANAPKKGAVQPPPLFLPGPVIFSANADSP
jgi:hypothetical protein